MANAERGIVIREITVKRPSGDMVGVIIRAQAEIPNRLVKAEWQNPEGATFSVTINPRISSTIREKQRLSSAAASGIVRLTVLEILPF